MIKQIEVDYVIGQTVKIKLTQMQGIVKCIHLDRYKISYKVEWAVDDSKIHSYWFVTDELERIE